MTSILDSNVFKVLTVIIIGAIGYEIINTIAHIPKFSGLTFLLVPIIMLTIIVSIYLIMKPTPTTPSMKKVQR